MILSDQQMWGIQMADVYDVVVRKTINGDLHSGTQRVFAHSEADAMAIALMEHAIQDGCDVEDCIRLGLHAVSCVRICVRQHVCGLYTQHLTQRPDETRNDPPALAALTDQAQRDVEAIEARSMDPFVGVYLGDDAIGKPLTEANLGWVAQAIVEMATRTHDDTEDLRRCLRLASWSGFPSPLLNAVGTELDAWDRRSRRPVAKIECACHAC